MKSAAPSVNGGNGNMIKIDLKEDLSIKSIKGFYGEVGEAIKGKDEVILDFSNIERLDLSIIQVIMSALGEVRAAGRAMRFKGVPAGVRNQLNICGLLKNGVGE